MHTSRRTFLQLGSAILASTLLTSPRLLRGAGRRQPRPIGFSLYGMKSLPVLEALDHCAEIGYNNVELCVMKDFPTEVAKFSPRLRRQVKDRLRSTGLELSSLLFHGILARQDRQVEIIETIKRSGEIARDLDERNPPLLETVMGGASRDWEANRSLYVERLRAWLEAADAAGVDLAVKAHYGHTVDSPERLLWLYRNVDHPRLKLTYDYSHYQAEGFKLEESMRAVIPFTGFIHMKDVALEPQPRFLLPGEGTIDYVRYFRLLDELAYTGPILVEVSAHIHRLPGYEPLPAARKAYAALSRARDAAGKA